MGADMLALCTAACLGYFVWVKPILQQSPALYADLLPFLWLFPLGYMALGLYPGFGVGAVETLRRLSCCTSFAFLVLAAASFALQWPPHYSRMTFAIAWVTSLVTVPMWRFLVLSIASRWQWWGEPTVLIGSSSWVCWAVRALGNAFSLGYRPVGILLPDLHRDTPSVEEVPVLGGIEMAPYFAERGVRVALVEVGENGFDGTTLNRYQQCFQHVVVMRQAQDLPVERVRIRNLGGFLGIEFTNGLLHWHNRVAKRLLDLIFGTIFLLLALPMIALGGLLVKLLSRGSFFFYQRREGAGGHPIKVWKLRTMYQDAEQRLEAFLTANPEQRQEWEKNFKLTDDPRIIPGIGPFLRRFSVDELPQLWNVVKGEMSLVGPRPFPEYHLREFPAEFRELRKRVRPGLTGMWQVMVRSDGGIEAPQIYDTYYIRNWSIWLDLWILSRTIFAVSAGRGAR
jgi:Undecaprenyl-phosphate galactose phosphotransferase WbaP